MAIVITTNDGETQKNEVFETRDEVKPAVQEPARQEPEKKPEASATEEKDENRDTSLDYLNNSDEEDEDSEDDLGEDEDEDESEAEEQKPKKNGFKKRIDKITKEKAALKAENEALKALVNKPANEKTAPAPKEPVVELKEPQPDDFETHTDYVKALTKFEIAVERQKMITEQYESEVKKESGKIIEAYNKKVEEAKKFYGADKWDKIKNVDAPITWTMQQEILDSDIGPHITYYLANNVDECKEICSLPQNKQVKRLLAIEAKLADKVSKDKKPVEKVSNAPAPIKPIGASSAEGKGKKDPSKMSYSEYKVWHAEKNRNK